MPGFFFHFTERLLWLGLFLCAVRSLPWLSMDRHRHYAPMVMKGKLYTFGWTFKFGGLFGIDFFWFTFLGFFTQQLREQLCALFSSACPVHFNVLFSYSIPFFQFPFYFLFYFGKKSWKHAGHVLIDVKCVMSAVMFMGEKEEGPEVKRLG